MLIRSKLTVIFLALSLIPACLVGVLSFNRYGNYLEADRLSDLRNIIVYKADRIETYIAGLKAELKIAQGLYNVKKNFPVLIRYAREPEAPERLTAKKILDVQLQEMQSILRLSNIILASLEGDIIYATDPSALPKAALPDEAQRAFREAKNSIALSDVFFDPLTNGLKMDIAAPITDSYGTLVGVIAFEMNMGPLYTLIQDTTGLGQTGETLIGKKIGDQVVFLNPLRYDPEAALKRHIDIGDTTGVPIQKAAQGSNGDGRSIDYRGNEVIAAWRYLPAVGWGMVAKIDAKEAFAEVVMLRNLIMLILSVVFILSGVTAFFLARSISAPIKKLSKDAEIIGSGNLDHKVTIDSRDEIGQLSRSFDKMTGDLKKITASRDELNREIAEHKQVKETLANERGNLQRIFDCVSIGMLLIDQQGGIKRVNNAVRSWVGKDLSLLADAQPGSALGCIHALADPAGCGHTLNCRSCAIRNAFESVIRSGKPVHGIEAETVLVIKGEPLHLWLDISADPVSIDGKKHAILALSNITRRKDIEREITRLAAYPQLDPNPIVEVDYEGTVFYQNPAAEKLLASLDKADMQHEFFPWLASVLDAFQKGYKGAAIREVFVNDTWFQQTFRHVPDMKRICIYCANITVRKRITEALRRTNNELEAKVAERTAELIKAESDLIDKKRLSDIGTLAATVAHELRNPLAAIKMASYNIKRKAGNPALEKHLNNIDIKLSESEQIIDNLLYYARIKSPNPSSADIYDILNECIAHAVDHFSKHTVSVRKDIDALQGIPFEADVLQMKEVFANLLSNSFDAMVDNKGTITITGKVAEGAIRVSIQDNGAGIDKEDLHKIFDPFFTTKAKGTGLGLSVCQQIVRLHGGRIDVASEKNKGTTIQVTLPRIGAGTDIPDEVSKKC
ncbi:MAG: ATP-binding protein [Candidatus Omnitrophica bacterium]|nr:ATP-binding protein [Candidatus Omnitrophota bacterium]